ncbi:hypothetical protein Tco_1297531 [Tanacetum coccineum]
MVPEVDPDCKLKALSLPWDELVVRVQHSPSNPSLLFVLTSSQPLKGFVGLSVLPGERVIGVLGRWEWVGGCRKVYWRGGLGEKQWEMGCLVLGGLQGFKREEWGRGTNGPSTLSLFTLYYQKNQFPVELNGCLPAPHHKFDLP